MKMVMYHGVYAPWEHYPKFLRQSEVRNPLIPLKGFFDANTVEGHIEKLKRWRFFVVGVEHYDDVRFGPGNLLYDYELNIRLLESLYLLLLDYQEHSYSYTKITEADLAGEKERWVWYPSDLTEKELLNPHLIIKAGFDEVQPQEFRDHLWEWINAALSSNPIDESMTPGEFITVYEHLVKLYSAAWLIFRRETEGSHLKRAPESANTIGSVTGDQREANTDTPVNNDTLQEPSPAEKLGLKAVADLIVKTTPSVQLIMHLATHQNPFIFFLFVVIDHREMHSKEKIAVEIEKNCSKLVSVVAIVKKLRRVRKAVKEGLRFINNALWCKNTIYRSTSLKLPRPQYEFPITMNQREIVDAWEQWGSHGHMLGKDAMKRLEARNYLDSLFGIDQAIESLLRGLIKMHTGFLPYNRNIVTLLKMTLLFTEKYWDLFYKDAEPALRAIGLLTSEIGRGRDPLPEPVDEEAIKILLSKSQIIANSFLEEYSLLLTEASGQ